MQARAIGDFVTLEHEHPITQAATSRVFFIASCPRYCFVNANPEKSMSLVVVTAVVGNIQLGKMVELDMLVLMLCGVSPLTEKNMVPAAVV